MSNYTFPSVNRSDMLHMICPFMRTYRRYADPSFRREEPVMLNKWHSVIYKSGKVKGNHKDPTPYCKIMVLTDGFEPARAFWSIGSTYYYPDNPVAPTLFNMPHVVTTRASNQITVPLGPVDRVRTKAMANLVDSDLHLGATAVELLETSNYMARKFKTYGECMLALSGEPKATRWVQKHLKLKIVPGWSLLTLSQRWLEWRYAILPLVSDIQGAWDLMNKGLSDNFIEVSAGSRFSEELPHRYTIGNINNDTTYTRKYSCRITATIEDPHLFAMAKLGLDFKSALWEAVPFSFVLDWGYKVGTYLQALNVFNSGLKFKRGYVSVFIRGSSYASLPGSFSNGYVKQKLIAYARNPLSSFPVPTPYRVNPFTGKNLITAVALHTVLSNNPSLKAHRL